jgi:hypothetical protein
VVLNIEHLRVRLCYDKSTFWGDHDSLGSAFSGYLDGLQKASWNSGRSLYPGSIVIVTVVVGGAVLYPVS